MSTWCAEVESGWFAILDREVNMRRRICTLLQSHVSPWGKQRVRQARISGELDTQGEIVREPERIRQIFIKVRHLLVEVI